MSKIESKKRINVLIPGGAGFLGGHIAHAFLNSDCEVTVIDGLLPQTGGHPRNLPADPALRFIKSRIEDCDELPDLLNNTDLVVDCIAWTRHTLAMKDPFYDLDLNLRSHLHLIKSMAASNCRQVVFLGSRGQYGGFNGATISETAPQSPNDVQAIHKIAAESHFALASRIHGIHGVSLRFGNCFGERQPMKGPDVGLFGGFLRELMDGGMTELYGKSRMREFLYAPDLANITTCIASKGFTGFNVFNIAGSYVRLSDLLNIMIRILGKGAYLAKEFPEEIKRIDIGEARLDGSKLAGFLGDIPFTPLEDAIRRTISNVLAGQQENLPHPS